MNLPFIKYQGTGNDFVMLVEPQVTITTTLIEKLCHRKFGIGADGLIVMQKEVSEEVDFKMHYYNADGSESFCGNGSRCAIHLAHELGWFEETTVFQSNDGLHKGRLINGTVSLEMHLTSPPLLLNSSDTVLNTGSPHYVHETSEDKNVDVIEYGKRIRNSEPYKEEGINVNIYRTEGETLHLRTYERGVEDETLSCGTGVTAVAISHFTKYKKSPGQHTIPVQSEGGKLSVDFNYLNGSFSDIFLNGPAVKVFEGRFEL